MTIQASNVWLGNYKLSKSQIERLGKDSTVSLDFGSGIAAAGPINFTEDSDTELLSALQLSEPSRHSMNYNGFSPFVPSGNYLYASTKPDAPEEQHIGQYRVSFEYDLCGPATVMAQQVADYDELTTFRPWNPEKLFVPFDQSTRDEISFDSILCFFCCGVDAILSRIFQQVMDFAEDSTKTAE